MSGRAMKRLMREYAEMVSSPPEGIIASPVSESDVFTWRIAMSGPPDSFYEGALLEGILTFPKDYPLSPPKLQFTSPVWHPNVYFPSGKVCISILHAGRDASGYEDSSERWSPVQSVNSILLSVLSMLADPNDESPANVDAAVMWRQDKDAFAARVKRDIEAVLAIPYEVLSQYSASSSSG